MRAGQDHPAAEAAREGEEGDNKSLLVIKQVSTKGSIE